MRVKGFCNIPHEMAKNFDLKPDNTNNYIGNCKNLRIQINSNSSYKINGSIWRYFKGDNAGLFTMNDFEEAVEELNSLTFGTFSKCDVILFELGLNIEVALDPLVYLNLIIGAILNGRIKLFFPAYRKQKLWKKVTQESFSNYKVYSKSFEQKIKDRNVLRIERVVKNVKGHFKRSLDVASLLEENIYAPWIDEFKQVTRNLILKPSFEPMELSKLSTREAYKRLLLCEMDLPCVLGRLKEYGFHPKTLEAERSSIKKILANSNCRDSFKQELIIKIIEGLDNASYV